MPRFVNKLAANLGALNKLWSEPKWMAHAELKVAFAKRKHRGPTHARTQRARCPLATSEWTPL